MPFSQVQEVITAPTDFADISGPIVINASGDTTTNYTDVGVTTNNSTRQYRVRLVA